MINIVYRRKLTIKEPMEVAMKCRGFILAVMAIVLTSCYSYSGISKFGKHVYVSGQTSILIFHSFWLKRCYETEKELYCTNLEIKDNYINVPLPDNVQKQLDSIQEQADANCRMSDFCKVDGKCRSKKRKCVK